MSRISLATATPTTSLALVKFLHQRLGLSLSAAQGYLRRGAEGLFYSAKLFHNDHVQREQELRDILAFFNSAQVPLLIVETDPDEEWNGVAPEPLQDCTMPQEHLFNLLQAHEEGYQ
ncbi:hypothetical protein C5U62_02740 [Pseudomonas protegens]|uniref:Uncharacterized protein n=1 Tax=Pseudomonas protegens TaxID=380021 RepID=A0A2T6GRY9_9PSED|nr:MULTISPECIES: hypothetical protein [Pseudomonas]PUA46914.1 hypothetical protein C5U62_02740 [Pseudomonas protegens]ULT68212.1 hypothetical protein L1O02_17505 [Pseudomonas sp. BC42]